MGCGDQAAVTVVETPEFIARTKRLMTDEDREELIGHLARNPTAGDLVPGAGGIRKIRWRLEGRGRGAEQESSISFTTLTFRCSSSPRSRRSERVDLSQKDRNDFQRLTKLLVETYRRPKQ